MSGVNTISFHYLFHELLAEMQQQFSSNSDYKNSMQMHAILSFALRWIIAISVLFKGKLCKHFPSVQNSMKYLLCRKAVQL